MNDFLDKLYNFIDKPWKAVVVIVMFIVGGAGWVAYEKRDAIIESWLTPSTPYLKTTHITDALEVLATETSADLLQIWEIDLPRNTQQFYAARRKDGERPVIPAPRRLPVITTVSSAKALVDILNGHPVCIDLSKQGTPLAERLAARGMKRGCAVPIPPSAENFVGVIYLAWLNPPDERSENVAVGAARDIARTLVAQ
jgi:hypothetical protein